MSKIPSREEGKQFFDLVDQSGDGKVQPKELVDAMAAKGYERAEVLGWFGDIDKDDDNLITFEEFIEEVCKKPRSQTVESVFTQADKDGSGKLSRDELHKACEEAGLTDSKALQKGFDAADVDGSGSLDKAEFMNYMNTCY